MADAVAVTALVAASVNAVAALWGGWHWWTVEPARTVWALVRAGPVAVGLVAEQFRAASAQTVLDARELEDAQAVGRLDEDGQRSVVLAILRREMGVMALAALVVAFLALRSL